MSLVAAPTWQVLETPVIVGECIKAMRCLPACSVDAVVTDPPYGIGFMGKEWDGKAIAEAAAKDRASRKSLGPESPLRPGRQSPRSSSAFGNEAIIAGPVRGGIDFQHWCERWALEALRVLKPGGHLLACGGTRTYQRLACGIEDAGFEIRDSIMWLYGSGFPKSHNLDGDWSGWGTALKPAHEPIVVARKPFKGTVAGCVLEHGTGAVNVDACRVGTNEVGQQRDDRPRDGNPGWRMPGGSSGSGASSSAGRWPANVVLSHLEECEPAGIVKLKGDRRDTGNGTRPGGFADVGADSGDRQPNASIYGDETVTQWKCAPGCPVAELDLQSGRLQSGSRAAGVRAGMGFNGAKGDGGPAIVGDSGGASRFFYNAKTSRAERGAGLDGFDVKTADPYGQHRGRWMKGKSRVDGKPAKEGRNNHPTVKPIDLMRWLVRLVTPPGGLVLDPFGGSGTTLCAADLEGVDCVLIEREPEYAEIARARHAFWSQHEGREVSDVLGLHAASQKQAKRHTEGGQGSLDELLEEAA